MPNINLADPELELIDPTPNVHSLFIHFDKEFFGTKLASKAAVRWSKRMYSCAGICTYDRFYCDIALSEPLLKLRPRKDLVETLLHEMIHAFLFITNSDRDRDGHGPNFQAHMHRINKAASLNISIYHSFHDEVKLYQTHWWRCNGPCVKTRPHFGIVRRSANRAPGPCDYWWDRHMKTCGGSFVKIKEPEKKTKSTVSKANKNSKAKPKPDITKYINMNKNQKNKPNCLNTDIPNNISIEVKKNSGSTVVIKPKGLNIIHTINTTSPERVKTITAFTGTGQSMNSTPTSIGKNAAETVRNIWANKQLSKVSSNTSSNTTNKRKSKDIQEKSLEINNNSIRNSSAVVSPPVKIKKIDDYFHRANSIIQELYGDNYELVKSDNSDKIIAINKEDTIKEEGCQEYVPCPVCNLKITKSAINKHLDECLNKDILEELSKSQADEVSASTSKSYLTDDEKPIKVNKDHVSFIKTDNTELSSNIVIKQEPGTSKDTVDLQRCACCGKMVAESIEEHLDECLAFFDDNTVPEEGTSTSIIVIDDDDDVCNESQTMNETGTKFPCPSCLKMIEETDMNSHLDMCLS